MKEKGINPKMYMYKRIVDAKLFIDNHYAENIDLDNISNQANFSKYHFIRLFKSAFGKSPHQYLIEVRVSAAKQMLKESLSVTKTCYKIGFESPPSFISLFKKLEGITPSEYKKRFQQIEKQKMDSPLSFVPNCFVENFGWDK